LATINFTDLGLNDDDACSLFRRLRTKLRRAWKYQRQQKLLPIGHLDDVGAHENPNGIRHVHWMVHVPPSVRPWFEMMVEKILKRLTNLSDLGTALQIKDVIAPGTLAKYILKGVKPELAGYFHMEAVDQGVVYGRRTFVSRSIGAKARQAASWKRKRRAPSNHASAHPVAPTPQAPGI
jgi:hypothetical protein